MKRGRISLLGVAVLVPFLYSCAVSTERPEEDSGPVVYLHRMGHCDAPGPSRGLYVSGKHAYVVGNKGFRIIDISDPSNLQAVGHYYPPAAQREAWRMRGVHVVWHYAYVAIGNGGLRIVDISDISRPKELGFHSGSAWDVQVVGDCAYVAAGNGLRVIDVADPENPREIGFYDTTGGIKKNHEAAQRVRVVGEYAYLVAGDRGVRVIDVSSPMLPREISSYRMHGCPVLDVYINGKYAYVSGGYGLRVVDISVPSIPREVGEWDPRVYHRRQARKIYCATVQFGGLGVHVIGDYAYVIGDKIYVMDVSNPRKPRLAGGGGASGPRAVHVTDDYIYATAASCLWILRLDAGSDTINGA
ncbi:LVIVD repeat-containing protein [Candidatus Poribacteria bacterium]